MENTTDQAVDQTKDQTAEVATSTSKSGAKIPTTIITGFLGAGKTTLIRNILQNANGKRIALIINEFGDLGVDGDVLKGCGIETCTEDDIVELTNGCICCTVADDFVPTITKLLERENRPDHIVIETSGLALPQPLVSAFNWPEIREQVTVDGVVTVVDSRAVADGQFAADVDKVNAQREADDALDHESPLEELFQDQITCADMIVLNKADLLDESTLTRVKTEIEDKINREVKVIHASHGSVPVEVLLGMDAATEGEVENRKSRHEKAHDEEHGHDSEAHKEHHHHEHDHDQFESFVVEGGIVANRKALVRGLHQMLADHKILRMKGFVAIKDKPMRLVVQVVGNRIEHYFDRNWYATEERKTRLVVIGLDGMEKTAITRAVYAAFK